MSRKVMYFNKTGALKLILAADTLKAAKLRTELKKIAKQNGFPKTAELTKYLDALTEKDRLEGHKLMEELAEYFPDSAFMAWFYKHHKQG